MIRAPPADRSNRVAAAAGCVGRGRAIVRVRRVVAERCVLDQMPDHVDAKAVDAAPQPEAQVSCHASLRARPGCASSDRAAPPGRRDSNIGRVRRIQLPGRAAEHRPASCSAALPSGAASRQTYQSRFALSRDARLSRNHGCWSEVWLGTKSSSTLRPALARPQQAVEVGHACRTADRRRSSRRCRSRNRPSARQRSATARSRRRRVRRGGQSCDDAGQVADAVAVRVLKRARIDLIDDRRLPPMHARRPMSGSLRRCDGRSGHKKKGRPKAAL